MAQGERPRNSDIQGEGDYRSARRFQEEERAFVKSGQVDKKAREAADALKGPEGQSLEAARRSSAKGRPARSAKSGDQAAKPPSA